jgi:crotonobetainyl-CoA:carnitine CoA-transferase CaiB-like acyl-CoA transferase
MDAALAGLRVLDLSNLFAAPLVAAILGDFGADVVKVEPPAGDPLRRMGGTDDGNSLVWATVNRNKRGITLDLDTAAGREALHRLVGDSDVLVENLPAEVRSRWHCTYEELTARNPDLVVVSVSCYGRSGPYAERPGAGTLAEAFAGLSHMTGTADGPPMLASVALGDVLAGTAGALGALVACYARARGGPGQHVDVSMYEPVLQLLAAGVTTFAAGGPAPHRMGSRVAGGAPRNVYRTAGGEWIAISGTTDAQVARLLPLLGLDTEAGRARFGTSAARLHAADELDALVAEWVAARSRNDVLARLLEHRIPAAPVNDLPALLADPHVAARGDVVPVVDPDLGAVAVVAPVPKLSATPGRIRTPGPRLGEHNDEVL